MGTYSTYLLFAIATAFIFTISFLLVYYWAGRDLYALCGTIKEKQRSSSEYFDRAIEEISTRLDKQDDHIESCLNVVKKLDKMSEEVEKLHAEIQTIRQRKPLPEPPRNAWQTTF